MFAKTKAEPFGLVWVMNDPQRFIGAKVKWEDFQLTWDNNRYEWDAVRWIGENFGSSPRKRKLRKLRKLTPQQFDQVIKLVCKVKGVDYRITRRKRSGIKITIEDIELLVKEIKKTRPELFLENINV